MLSVIIIAKNEEQNIGRCLESLNFADEIIVLDSGSSDNTVAIAKKYTEKVFQTDWQGYGVQKQRALLHTSGDWVLNLDADEYITQDLQKAIKNAISNQSYDGYRIPIRMNFYGKPLRFSSSPKRHIRLFKRKGARFSSDIVHEKIILPPGAKIKQLNFAIMHHSFRDVSHALTKINHYSSHSAKIRIEANKSPNFTKTLFSSVWMFCRCYFLQRGFLDGKAGFLFAAFNAQGAFYRGIKHIYKDKDLQELPPVIRDSC